MSERSHLCSSALRSSSPEPDAHLYGKFTRLINTNKPDTPNAGIESGQLNILDVRRLSAALIGDTHTTVRG